MYLGMVSHCVSDGCTTRPHFNKINPLLDKPEIYDYDENTGKIQIKNLKEWKNIINEIKNDIRALYEN
jgi:hypothetical protein